MSDGIGFTVGTNDKDEYRIVRKAGCILVFGQVPLEDMSVITKLAPKKALMSFTLPRLFDATFVFGLEEDLEALLEASKPELFQKAVERYRPHQYGLTQEEVEWLAYGERGVSSETIFQKVRGVPVRLPNGFNRPHDPADLRRCRLLLELSPKTAERFKEVMGGDPAWAGLVERWDELCAVMDEEVPHWRDSKSRSPAPRTRDMMDSLLT